MLYQGFAELRRSKEALQEVRLKIAKDGVLDEKRAGTHTQRGSHAGYLSVELDDHSV